MTSILDGALDRRPFAGEGGRSGAEFEQAVLRDGTPVVIKHISPEGLVPRMLGRTDAFARLWSSGALQRVPKVIDHTMLALEPSGDGWVLVMTDRSDAFLGDERVLTRVENRFVLSAMNEMYREFRGQKPDGACSLEQYFDVFLSWSGMQAASEEPIIKLFIRGWELFPDVAPSDIVAAMEAIHRDPAALAQQLNERDSTFIHGDLRLHNLGLSEDRVVLLDWELASYGPPAVDFAWYLIISATRIDATREEITDDFRTISGDEFDPVALELAMTTALAQLGWNKALDILENPDPAIREQERADLDWWIARVRRSLETWSPI
jgi:hypothetical protein